MARICYNIPQSGGSTRMAIIIHQPTNGEKSTPMCAFDPKQGWYGHEFKNFGMGDDPIIVCVRCGALWDRED